MSEPSRRRSWGLDILIVGLAVGLLFACSKLGLRAGQPATAGPGAVVGGGYLVYLGLLFLLSYVFPEACYVFSFMRYVSEECSRPRSRHMALFYCVLLVAAGTWLLLVGLGVL